MKWIIYELRIWNQVKLWSSQLWALFLQLRREAWKIQDFNGVWTRDFAIPVRRSNQLSYEATDVGSWSFVGSNSPVPLKSWIFQASLRNCKNCAHNCEDHSFTWFHIRSSYMIHFIYHFISFNLLLYTAIRTHKWPAPNVSGFIAQLVRASHRNREVTGSNPVEVLNFSGFSTQLQKLRS